MRSTSTTPHTRFIEKNQKVPGKSHIRFKTLIWKFYRDILPPVALVVSLFGIYLATLAPGLTWANAGADGGDLITAAFTGGIAHPTGYPLYLLLARLFQFLPLGSLAYRTNLMSAFFMALAAALVYRLVVRSLGSGDSKPVWPAGLVAGYAFGLAPLVWSQAVITEVHALQAFLTLSILYLYTQPEQVTAAGQKRLDYQRGLALGLGLSNHLTTLLLLPVALFLGSFSTRNEQDKFTRSEKRWFGNYKFDRISLLRQLACIGLGLSLYLILPLRALGHPPLNWGNPHTLGRTWWLVSGSLYQGYYLQFSLSGLWEGLRSWAALQFEQFGVPGLVLGLTGLVYFWRPSRLYILTAWIAALFLAFAVFYNSVDSYLYLIPMFTCFAVWIGLGVGGLLGQSSQRYARSGSVIGLLLIGYFAGRSLGYLGQVDASHDLRAETFSAEVLAAAPENAILFAQGDGALFALWYVHFALGGRPDLAVIAVDLLHFDWYQETLRSTYPSLILPGQLPWPGTVSAANPARPACYVRYTDQTEIECNER
jgi:hypothetical protein